MKITIIAKIKIAVIVKILPSRSSKSQVNEIGFENIIIPVMI